MTIDYPSWICGECGSKHGRREPDYATYHYGDKCGWCGRDDAPVTEPRDFGYPRWVKGGKAREKAQ